MIDRFELQVCDIVHRSDMVNFHFVKNLNNPRVLSVVT